MKLRLGKEPASSVKLTLALPRLQPAPSPSPSPFVKPPSEASASIHATTPILQPAAQIRPPMGIMPTHPAIARLTSHELVHDRSLSPIQPPIQPPSAIGTPLPTSSFPPTPALPNGIPASAPPTTPDPNPLNPTLYDPAGLPYGPDSLLRRPNRTAANALISSLTLTSHPSLKLPQTFTQLFLPSDRFSQLAHTLHLPAAVSSLQLSLVVAKEMQVRASKVVCSFRGGVLKPVRSVPTPTPNTTTTTTTATTTTTTTTTTTATTPAATTTTTEGGAAVEIPAPQTMQYELALAPGSNVIEFDAIAANAKEVPKRADTGDVDHEKVQLLVFLHLPSSVDGVVEGMGRL